MTGVLRAARFHAAASRLFGLQAVESLHSRPEGDTGPCRETRHKAGRGFEGP
jgi:hypothetical protein